MTLENEAGPDHLETPLTDQVVQKASEQHERNNHLLRHMRSLPQLRLRGSQTANLGQQLISWA